MHRLYQKNELHFALIWVAIYCAVMTLLRGRFGDESPVTVLAHAFINASSRYAVEESLAHRLFIIATIFTAVVYGSYLWKLEDKKSAAGETDGAQVPN